MVETFLERANELMAYYVSLSVALRQKHEAIAARLDATRQRAHDLESAIVVFKELAMPPRG